MALTLDYFINAVWKGKQAVAEAVKGFKETGEAAEKADKQTKGFVQTAGEIAGEMGNVAAAVGAAGVVFKQAFDLANEGAQITETQMRFESLMHSIDAGVGTLEDLRRVTAGQATDFDLMSSANALTVMGLANTREELLRHFDVVTRLKKPNEEFGDALENWSLLLANQSLPRLDSFGISSGRVRERINELTTGINAMDRETAFVIATLEQAEGAIEKTGRAGVIAGNSFERLSARVNNFTDSLKVSLSEGLEPWVNFVLGDYAKAVEEVVRGNEEIIGSSPTQSDFQGLLDGLDSVNNLTGKVSGAYEQQRLSLLRVIAANADFSGGNRELIDSIAALTGETVQLVDNEVRLRGQVVATTDALRLSNALQKRGAERAAEAAKAIATQAKAEERRTMAIEENNQAREDALSLSRESSRRIERNNALLVSSTEILGRSNFALENRAEGLIVANRFVEQGTTFEKEYADALEQAIQQQEAQAEISRQLAERQAAFNATMGDYFVLASDTKQTNEELGQTLFDLADKYGANAEQLAALGLEYDLLDPKQAQHKLQNTLITAQMELLTEQYAKGEITLNELTAGVEKARQEASELTIAINENTGAVTLFESGMVTATDSVEGLTQKSVDLTETLNQVPGEMGAAKSGTDEFAGSVMTANEEVSNLIKGLDNIDGRNTQSRHTHTTDFQETGTPPQSGIQTGLEGAGFIGASTGGRVRGGRAGRDSVPAMLTPGEIVIPTSSTGSLEDAMNFVRRFVEPMNITMSPPANNVVNNNVGGQEVVINVTDNKQAAIVGSQLANDRRAQLRRAAFGGTN